MPRSGDTSPEARERQLAAYRAMSPEQRLRLAVQMSADVRSLAVAGSQARRAVAGRPAARTSPAPLDR